MAGLIPRAFIHDLLVRVDLVDLINSHVPLKKSGSNYMARCPFHNEKSPSFSVNRSKQFYHCFGCGVSGNAISFLMDFSHLNFVEAVEALADFLGLDVPRESGNPQNQAKTSQLAALYQLLENVARFYAQQLRLDPQAQAAVAYLKGRGLTGQIAKAFQLGYAANQWQNLSAHFPRHLLLEAGLVVKNDNGKEYDRFRGRVMFPIRDKRGRVIGFGGRVLDDTLPKYLNSPETAVFSKGQHVYGLYELLKKTPKPAQILIVEGYMDVIALAQYGVEYAVATLGTATSKTHLDLLFQFTPKLVFCFDGDNAGRQAAWRATETILPNLRDGREVYIMLLPEKHDPDSLVREQGVAGLEQHIQAAQSLLDYFFDRASETINLTTPEGQAKLVNDTRPYLEKLPAGLLKEKMFSKLKQLSNADTLDNFAFSTKLSTQAFSEATIMTQKELSPAQTALALLLQHPHLAHRVAEKIPPWAVLESPDLQQVQNLIHTILSYPSVNTGLLIELYRGVVDEVWLQRLANWEFSLSEPRVEAEFLGAIDKLLQQLQQVRITQLLEKARRHGLSPTEKDQLKQMLISKP